MAAVAFGLFLLVFQVLGVFGIQLPHELYGRWNSRGIKQIKPWNYRTFKDVERFYLDRFHKIPSVDRYFNYQIFPSYSDEITIQNDEITGSRGTRVKSVGLSSLTTSWEKTIDYKEPILKWRKIHQRTKSTPGIPIIIPQTSIPGPEVSEKLIQHSDESKNEISLILDTENEYLQNNNSANTIDVSHKEKIADENTSVEKETEENANVEKKTNDILSVDDEKNNTIVEKVVNNTIAIEEKVKETVEEVNNTSLTKKEEEGAKPVNDQLNITITSTEDEKKTTITKDTRNRTTSAEDQGNEDDDKETVKMITVEEEIGRNTTDVKSDYENTVAEKNTVSQVTITSDESENSTKSVSDYSEPFLNITTISADHNTSGVTYDKSPSGKIQPTTVQSTSTEFSPASETVSKRYTDGSTSGIQPSSTYTKSEGTGVTDSISIIPEHIINIRTIKTAKIVLATLLLVTCLIAVALLAACVFRVKRSTVQYDQLTLLP